MSKTEHGKVYDKELWLNHVIGIIKIELQIFDL